MSRFFIRRPIVAIVIAILFVVGGAVMVFRLPVAQFPEIAPPQIETTAMYTGADALTVEQSVATPIDAQVNGAKRMIYMQAISGNDGTMTLQVSFETGTDIDIDQVQVQNRLAQAQANLPTAVNNYGLTTIQTAGIPLLVFTINSPNKTWDQNFLSNYVVDQRQGRAGPRARDRAGEDLRRGELRHARLGRAGHDREHGPHGDRPRERDHGAERRESRGHARRRAGAARPAAHVHGAGARPPDERRGVRRHHRARERGRIARAA